MSFADKNKGVILVKTSKIKKIISGTVSALMVASSIPFVASAADQQTRGNVGGYDYEMWNQNGQGQASMNPGAGSFTCSWSNIENFLARMGKNFDSQKKNYKAFGNIVLTYDVEYTPRGNSYMCVYGWTRNPLMEYYIVEGWGDWRPPGNDGERKGNVTLNGNTYEIAKTMRYNQPSLDGTSTFPQYWSIRTTSGSANNQTNYMKGTIDVSKHFDAWSQAGLDMSGTLYEVSLNIEGYRSNGSANVKSVTVTTNATDDQMGQQTGGGQGGAGGFDMSQFGGQGGAGGFDMSQFGGQGGAGGFDMSQFGGQGGAGGFDMSQFGGQGGAGGFDMSQFGGQGGAGGFDMSQFGGQGGAGGFDMSQFGGQGGAGGFDMSQFGGQGGAGGFDMSQFGGQGGAGGFDMSQFGGQGSAGQQTGGNGGAQVQSGKKLCAISFDDGASAQSRQDPAYRIIDALIKNNMTATFFIVSDWIKTTDQVKYEYENGMEVANHTKSHPSLGSMGSSQIRSEWEQCNSRLKSIIGTEPSHLMRLPYLDGGGQVTSALYDVPLISCAIDTEDWNNASKDQIVNKIKQAAQNGSLEGAIVLCHENYATTAAAMEEVLPWLAQNGYQNVNISDMAKAHGKTLGGGQIHTRA